MCVLYPDEEDVLYQLCDTEDSSDEVLEESYTQVTRKQASQVTHTTCTEHPLIHSNAQTPNPY